MSRAAPRSPVPCRHRRLTGGVLWLLSGGAVLAQDASFAGVTLEELSVAGTGRGIATIGYQPKRSTFGAGSDTAILDTPANIAVVSSQVLRDQRVLTLDEAVRNVAGVTQANGIAGTQDAVVRRGFGAARDESILRDGRRTVLLQNFNYGIDRVEVLKGPASLLYGITDPGGLVNLVSKRPEYVSHGSLNLTGTSYGGGIVQGDLTGPVEGTNLAYRVVGDFQDYQYWRNFGSIERQVVAPSVTWKGDDTTVTVGYEFAHYRIPFDRGTIFDPRTGRPVPLPRDRRLDERINRTEAQTHLATLDIEHRFDADWALHFGYTFSNLTYGEDKVRPVSYNAATGVLTRRAEGLRGADFNAHVARLDLTGRFDTFGIRHDLLAGMTYETFDYYRRDVTRGPNVGGFRVFAPVYGQIGPTSLVSRPDTNVQERISNASVYLQDSIHITDRLILVGGVSAQAFDQYAAKGLPQTVYTNVDGTRVLPRAGLVYKLAPELSLYGSYSQSFRPNQSLSDIVLALAPEEGEAFEAGVKADLGAGLTITGAVFDIDKSNVLVTQIDSQGRSVATTAGRVRSQGFELDIVGQILPDWAVIASYGFTQAVVTQDPVLAGKQLLNTPRVTASAFLTHQFGAVAEPMEFGSVRLGVGFLEAGFGGRYVGARPGDAANTFRLPEYAVFDAFLAYNTQVNGLPTTLQLNLKNLFDRANYPYSAGSNLLVTVGEPFQALVTARVAW